MMTIQVVTKRGTSGDGTTGVVQDVINRMGFPLVQLKVDDDYGRKTLAGVLAVREQLLRGSLVMESELNYWEHLARVYEAARAFAAEKVEAGLWPRVPRSYAEIKLIFGGFDSVPRPGEKGWINITRKDPQYRIVKAELPISGPEWIHEGIAGPAAELLRRVEALGLASEVEHVGCYATRHICRNPRKRLSIHSWGIAIDINSPDNRMGSRGLLHPAIVMIARGLGFTWGGTWGSSSSERKKGMDGNTLLNLRKGFGGGKDDMHFEYYAGNSLARREW